jgi:hypothetical protein
MVYVPALHTHYGAHASSWGTESMGHAPVQHTQALHAMQLCCHRHPRPVLESPPLSIIIYHSSGSHSSSIHSVLRMRTTGHQSIMRCVVWIDREYACPVEQCRSFLRFVLFSRLTRNSRDAQTRVRRIFSLLRTLVLPSRCLPWDCAGGPSWCARVFKAHGGVRVR